MLSDSLRQNELVRLSRRNKFICALMCAIHDLGIEGPNMRWPGQKPNAPVYLSGLNPGMTPGPMDGNAAPGTGAHFNSPFPPEAVGSPYTMQRVGSLHSTRDMDFSLGMKDMESMDDGGDVFSDHGPRRGVLPSTLRRVAEEREEDSPSVFRSASRRSKDSHNSFLRRRRNSNTTTSTSHGHGPSLRRPPQTGHSIWGRRSHDHDADNILPFTEPSRTAGTAAGDGMSSPRMENTTVGHHPEDVEMSPIAQAKQV